MLTKFGLAVAFSIMAAAPAWAEAGACGSEPIAPAIPSAAEIGQKNPADAQKAKHQAFLDIKTWQANLKDYRDCLDSTVSTSQHELQAASQASKPDQDKIKKLQSDIQAASSANSHSTDSEERVVNDFNALSVAYCSRADVDKSTCPKS